MRIVTSFSETWFFTLSLHPACMAVVSARCSVCTRKCTRRTGAICHSNGIHHSALVQKTRLSAVPAAYPPPYESAQIHLCFMAEAIECVKKLYVKESNGLPWHASSNIAPNKITYEKKTFHLKALAKWRSPSNIYRHSEYSNQAWLRQVNNSTMNQCHALAVPSIYGDIVIGKKFSRCQQRIYSIYL